MKFSEYLKVYGPPDKVIAVDHIEQYRALSSADFFVPVVLGMKVDHVELNESYPDRTVVFLRCPSGVLV